MRTVPPWPGSTSFRPMNQESMPGPVAIASHTCSGEAATSASLRPSNARPMSGPLLGFRDEVLDAGMDRHDHAVVPAAGGVLVVILGDQVGDGLSQFAGEGGPVGGAREAH